MSRTQITAHHRSKQTLIIRNLTTEIILRGHVTVTKSKKTRVIKLFSQLIEWSKKNELHATRHAIRYLAPMNSKLPLKEQPLAKLKDLAVRYKDRSGGYLRSFILAPRTGDNASLYRLQII